MKSDEIKIGRFYWLCKDVEPFTCENIVYIYDIEHKICNCDRYCSYWCKYINQDFDVFPEMVIRDDFEFCDEDFFCEATADSVLWWLKHIAELIEQTKERVEFAEQKTELRKQMYFDAAF